MKVEDLILVSIDDHVVEPPDMFDRHAPAKYRDRVPHIVHGRRRPREVAVRGPADRLDGPERGGQLAQGGVGLRPHRLRRDAPGCLRHPRARARHEPQRHPRLDVLPDLRRVRGRHVPGGGRQGPRARHGAGVQRLAHRRVVRGVPRPVHPARHPADLGPAAGGRRGAPRRGQGVPGDHHARAAAHPGPARATSTPTTGTRSSARCRRSRS